MTRPARIAFRILTLFLLSFLSLISFASYATTAVPILVYHNLDPHKRGSMTISTAKFEEQIQWIKQHGYTIIPLKELVAYYQGKIASIPAKSVVITDDDGRQSVYQYMAPIAEKYHFPVTLFIYPMIISKMPYAMTWNELKQLQKTGLFDVEDHTYWHPNFKQEKKRLSEKAYENLVYKQLVVSKQVLQNHLGTPITLLAWPFGIHNAYLETEAKKAGYAMAFSIACRDARKNEDFMAMPRYMIIEDQNMKTFAMIVNGYFQRQKRTG